MRKFAGILKGVGGWIGVVAAIVLGLTGSVGATTLDSSLFNESCDIRVAGYSGSETLTDFQVLVRLKENSPAGFSYADAGTDGEEIRFADSGGNLIPHEIQTWAPTGETLVWVKLPSLIGTNTTFTMYWSAKDGATLPAVTASDTWSNYVGVWHFEGDTGDAADSSPNGYTATYNGTDYVPLEQGPIGRGATLAASKRFVTTVTQLTSSSAARPLSSASKMTLSGWFYIDGAADNSSHTYFSKGSWNNGGWSVFPKNKTTMCLCGASSSYEVASFRDAFGKWVHCTFVFNGSTLSAYCNGGDTMSGSGSGSSAGDKTSYALSLFGYSGRTGKGDEMRVYNGTASATRILADYQVQINRRFLEFKRREALDAKLFNRQANIRVAGYQGSETLKDFQVLVRVTAGQPGGFFYEDVAANGADIRFADSGGNLIPHEIQTWNTSGESLIWVKLPLLAGTNTTFSMHWDAKDGATIPSVTAADTWSNYIGVWHFEDDTADAADSTANGYTATANIPDYSPTEAGVVGRARTVPKSTNLVVTGSTQLMTPMVPNSLLTRQRLTLSGWMKLASTDSASNYYTFMSKGGWNTGGFTIFYKSSTLMCVCGGSNSAEVTFPNIGGNWVYVTAVYNGTTAYGYANGGAVSGSGAIGATGDNPSYSLSLFGYGARTGFGDEFRFYNGVESPARIKADYDTQVSPTFLVYEANADDSDPAGYKYRTRMTVTGYTGASVLGDFPVLVRLSEGSPSGFSHLDCQADGSDLLFADADGHAIPHEIDTWNPGGESLVWVKLPKLLPGGTTFYMQYSEMNGLRPAAVKSTDVWTSYVGVWHFSEGTGAEKDSTLNNRTANYTGGGTYAPIENGGVGRGGTPSFTVAGSSKLTTGCAQPLSNPQKFTVSMWTKIATFSAYNPMMKGGYSSSGTSWYLEKRTDQLIVGPGGGGWIGVSYATVADQWTHYTVVLNGTAVSQYAMGAFIGSGTISPAAADNELYSLWFGGSGCDEVRIYNGTVTADRAKADYDTMADVDFVSASAVEERCMYARFDSIELDDSPAAVATYTVVWPGEGAESAAVSAEFWELGGSVTNSVGLAAAATGSGSATLPITLGVNYGVRLVFTSAAGTLRTDMRPLKTATTYTAAAPVADAVNRTVRFTGAVDFAGVGDTVLKLIYGRSPSGCTNEVDLASVHYGDAPCDFDSGLIACDDPVNPMPSVWYRYVLIETLNSTEIRRDESELRQVCVSGYSDDFVECDSSALQHRSVDGFEVYVFSNAQAAANFTLLRQPVAATLRVVGGAGGAVVEIGATNLIAGTYSVIASASGASSFGDVVAAGGSGGAGGSVTVSLLYLDIDVPVIFSPSLELTSPTEGVVTGSALVPWGGAENVPARLKLKYGRTPDNLNRSACLTTTAGLGALSGTAILKSGRWYCVLVAESSQGESDPSPVCEFTSQYSKYTIFYVK